MKRQRRKEGNIYKICLGNGTLVYAREGTFGAIAVYDSRTDHDLSIDEVVKLPVLFYVSVMDYAIKAGIWKVVGNRSLVDAPLPEVPPTGIKDVIDKEIFRIYFNSGQMRSATREEIEGLEPAMSWHPERVQKRLLDHYNGFPDRWKESLPSYYSGE
jgi:hypothetical protein